METIKKSAYAAYSYLLIFIKWLVLSSATGIVCGGVGTAFHKALYFATGFRESHDLIILCLPLGGLVIVFLYKIFNMSDNTGTNQIIDSIRSDGRVSIIILPLIFVSTVITHLFGGSAGREGAALQLGGSIGSKIGRLLKLPTKDLHIITLCGMSGVFAALFGTPLAAAVFAIEFISVGLIYYSAFVPCIISSLTAVFIAKLFGVVAMHFELKAIPETTFKNLSAVFLLAIFCAVVSILFCIAMKKSGIFFNRFFKNSFLRIAVGGIIIIGLAYLVGTRDYNGAGMDIVKKALDGKALPFAFILKIIFTAITIGSGYKGGEIVPTFFIGATLGCVAGSFLGLDSGFCAALGLICMFCGVTNSPLASIFLGVELFGSGGLLYFTFACAVCFFLSGNFSLYKSQKIVCSKTTDEFCKIYDV